MCVPEHMVLSNILITPTETASAAAELFHGHGPTALPLIIHTLVLGLRNW